MRRPIFFTCKLDTELKAVKRHMKETLMTVTFFQMDIFS